ncbi:hypothetical protein JCM33374_g3073 [Metschnikowia sp. JCM 33374]|nr:hypothetical protein JCM33374_g3073 [Metschnikowia sp. JCM 33374]
MNHASSKSLDGISAVKIARVAGRSPSADDTDQSYQFKFARSGDLDLFLNEDLSKIDVANDGVLSPPHIIVGEGNSSNKRSNSDILEEDSVDDAEKRGDIDNINDVFFSSAHSKQPSVPHLERSPVNRSTSSVEAGPSHSSVLDDVRLDAVGNSVKYLSVVSFLNTNFLESVYPVLLNSTISKLDTLLNEEMNRLLRSINRANCVVIPGRESLYRGFIEEAKSITHLANDHCAVKIDNLLSATDRSYGELNTSLIMELRKTNEKLDKLDRSLFSGVIRSSATIDERSQNYDLADHKFLYIALENAIVVFLRLVWIGVNIVKPVFVFVKFLWKLVMLIFQ